MKDIDSRRYEYARAILAGAFPWFRSAFLRGSPAYELRLPTESDLETRPHLSTWKLESGVRCFSVEPFLTSSDAPLELPCSILYNRDAPSLGQMLTRNDRINFMVMVTGKPFSVFFETVTVLPVNEVVAREVCEAIYRSAGELANMTSVQLVRDLYLSVAQELCEKMNEEMGGGVVPRSLVGFYHPATKA